MAYTFRHLFRDVAYGTLTRSERIRLHTQVAIWLENFAADRLDEFTELIAITTASRWCWRGSPQCQSSCR
jgi:hypothetical protein